MDMRFEMSAMDVISLCSILYQAINEFTDYKMPKMIATQFMAIIDKIRDYGQDAFKNREIYRDTVSGLKKKLGYKVEKEKVE